VILVLLLLGVFVPPDSDFDGVPDAVEQAVLDQFRPKLLVSADECDGLPAEFDAAAREPKVKARNGTLYGRVTPSKVRAGQWLEVHYYHLWGRDCGRNGHDLDAEQTAVLLERNGDTWIARYWWAAAHEATICERSNAARAEWLGAEHSGARLWVSRGKHASFLSQNLCSLGCGGDRCDRVLPVPLAKVLNLGEKDALADGVQWVLAGSWPMRDKFGLTFTASMLDRLDNEKSSAVVGRESSMYPVQAVALAGGETIDGLDTGKRETEKALGTAAEKTGDALKKATRSVREFLWGK